jgi:hypothetical protein
MRSGGIWSPTTQQRQRFELDLFLKHLELGRVFCKNKYLYRHNMLFRDRGSIVLHDVYELRKNSFVFLLNYMKMKKTIFLTLYENT